MSACRLLACSVAAACCAAAVAQGYRFDVVDLSAKYGLSELSGLSDMNNSGEIVGSDGTGRPLLIDDQGLHILPLPRGARQGYAFQISDSGVILGQASFHPAQPAKSVIWIDGQPIVPDVSPAIGNLQSAPLQGVNNLMQFAGTDHNAPSRPFTWSQAEGLQYLPVPVGATVSGAGPINDAGVIAGGYSLGSGRARAGRWVNRVFQDIHPAGYVDSQPGAITQNGDIGLQLTTSNAYRAGIWSNGVFTDFGSLTPIDYTFFGDLNSHRQAVGQATVNGEFNAYFWEDGTLYNLKDLVDPGLGIRFGNAGSINDNGQILAAGSVGRLSGRRLLLNPVPEVATWPGMICGVAPIMVARRRRCRAQQASKVSRRTEKNCV